MNRDFAYYLQIVVALLSPAVFLTFTLFILIVIFFRIPGFTLDSSTLNSLLQNLFIATLTITTILYWVIPLKIKTVLKNLPKSTLDNSFLLPTCERYGFSLPTIEIRETTLDFLFALPRKIVISSETIKKLPEDVLQKILLRELPLTTRVGASLFLMHAYLSASWLWSSRRITHGQNSCFIKSCLFAILKIKQNMLNIAFHKFILLREEIADHFFLRETGNADGLIDLLVWQYFIPILSNSTLPLSHQEMVLQQLITYNHQSILDLQYSLDDEQLSQREEILQFIIQNARVDSLISINPCRKSDPTIRLHQIINMANDLQLEFQSPDFSTVQPPTFFLLDFFISLTPIFAFFLAFILFFLTEDIKQTGGVILLFLAFTLHLKDFYQTIPQNAYREFTIKELLKNKGLGIKTPIPVLLNIKRIYPITSDKTITDDQMIEDNTGLLALSSEFLLKGKKLTVVTEWNHPKTIQGLFTRSEYPTLQIITTKDTGLTKPWHCEITFYLLVKWGLTTIGAILLLINYYF